MNETNKVGIFLCKCSENISKAVDFEKIKENISSYAEDYEIFEHNLLCSEDGKEYLKKTIEDNKLSKILIAGCSPKQHEITFSKVLEETSVNPFLLNMANIREQCIYTTEDPGETLDKANKMIKAAYKRLLLQKAIAKNEIDVNPDAVVIGGGISGIEAALLMTQKNRKVHLIEKNPNIGGIVTRQEELFPNMECATCLLEPKLDQVLHTDNLELHTLSEVSDGKGFAGNFEIKVTKQPRFVDEEKCLGCALCFEACPVEVDNEYNENMNKRKAIYVPYMGALPFVAAIDKEHCLRFKGEECNKCVEVCNFQAIDFDQKEEEIDINAGAVVIATGHGQLKKEKYLSHVMKDDQNKDRLLSSLEFERLISQTGPTNGEIKLKDDSVPQSFAIIHCAGSRSKEIMEYCSSICCMTALKYNKMIKSKIENAEVIHIYKDLVLSGKTDQEFFNNIASDNDFIRVDDIEKLEISADEKSVNIKTPAKDVKADMVILMTPITANADNEKLKEIFDLTLDKYGFIKEEHNLINSSGTELKGIYLAGTVQGPKNVDGSVLQADSSAGKVLSSLIPGEKMELEAIVSVIDENKCSGCKVCNSQCPYKAISFDPEKQISVIQAALCQGCGTCAASCPSGSITALNFENQQILTEVREVL